MSGSSFENPYNAIVSEDNIDSAAAARRYRVVSNAIAIAIQSEYMNKEDASELAAFLYTYGCAVEHYYHGNFCPIPDEQK